MPDAEIIDAVTVNEKMPEINEHVSVKNTEQTFKMSHCEELTVVETALQYFEQGASVIKFLFLWHLRDEETKRRVHGSQ
ncbi:hypothetical protein TNCV_2116471 [Trichonephila clavipes]|nr:hypothetical protein TNCV_2116471 [Trichonephila clavipes]